MSGFAKALLVYPPSLSLPLETRGRGPNLIRPCNALVHCYSAAKIVEHDTVGLDAQLFEHVNDG